MGSYTFTSFKQYLKSRLGENDAFDSYYGVWVNQAYRRLCTGDKMLEIKENFDFPQLKTSTTSATVDGTAYVAAPTDCLYVIEIYDETNDRLLDWTPFTNYVKYIDRSETSNEDKPIFWTRYGSNIYLYPTPDAAYTLTVYYKKRVADLTGTGVTDIGAEWDDVILEYAHYFARVWTNEFDKAKFSLEATKEMIASMMSMYNNESRARRETVRPDITEHYRPTY